MNGLKTDDASKVKVYTKLIDVAKMGENAKTYIPKTVSQCRRKPGAGSDSNEIQCFIATEFNQVIRFDINPELATADSKTDLKLKTAEVLTFVNPPDSTFAKFAISDTNVAIQYYTGMVGALGANRKVQTSEGC